MAISFEVPRWLKLFAFSALLSCGCEDLLPEYHPPVNVFDPFIAQIDTSIVVYHETVGYHKGLYTSYNYFFHPDSFFLYVLSNADPAHAGLRRTMQIDAYLVNTYDDVLQGTAEVRGEIVLWPSEDPATTATLVLTNSSIASPEVYSPATGRITVAPGERIYLRAAWNFRFSNNRWLHSSAVAAEQRQLSERVTAVTYSPVPMSGRITVRLVSGTNMEVLSFSFTLAVEGRIYTIEP